MKKSLVMSHSEKYPSSPSASVDEKADMEDRKYAPTITLEGKQAEAFGAGNLKVGDTGKATLHYAVKSVSSGDTYGDDLPAAGAPTKITLTLTDVESEGDEGSEDGAEESEEEPAGEATETGDDNDSEEDTEKSSDASDENRVSPKDADLGD